MNKLVFVSQRVDDLPQRKERRDALDQNWFEFLHLADVFPFPVANNLKTAMTALEKLAPSGIILTGGNSPVLYGGDAPERDEIDNLLIEYAVKHSLPLIGVCRGMQSIVLYFGGTLQEITGHISVRHEIYGSSSREVNSYHSLAVDKVPECFQITWRSKDNVVEGIRHKTLPLYAIMNHPERELPFMEQDIEFFRRIFK